MTIQQLYIFNALYLVLLVAVVVFTRANLRRFAGAMAGAIAAGAAGLVVIAICERAGWWHFALNRGPYYVTLLAISAAPAFIFLLTWRLARRFGGRGLGLTLLLAALLGPFRDSAYMAVFPQWGYYAPGIAPMLAISAAYVIIGVVGHGTMRAIAGPATADPLR